MSAPGPPSSAAIAHQPFKWSQVRLMLGNRYGLLAALVVGSVLTGFTESVILAVLAQVAAALVSGSSVVHLEVGALHLSKSLDALLALAFAAALARLALVWMISVPPARIAADRQAKLRSELFAAFTSASWGMQSRDHEGHLQEIATSQASQATQGTVQAAALLTGVITLLVLVLSALALNVLAALSVLVAAVGLFALLRPLSTLASRRSRELSQASIEYAGGISEAIRLAEETQVFGAGAAMRERIERLLARVSDLYYHTLFLARLAPGVYQSLIYILVIAALAGLYAAHVGHVASLGAVVLLLVRAGTYGQQIQVTYQSVRGAMPNIERVEGAQRRYSESSPPAGTVALDGVQTLAFEHVHFAYEPSRPTLIDISFEVARGEAIGIVGPSGAGKSTLVQILLGLRPPGSGHYLINGTPAGEFRREDLNRRLAYVPQDPRLLHASVAENIRYFRDLDDDAVQRAAELAGIHEVVMGWSRGYDTVVGPRADAVSGGQQQRICLARALAAQPEMLVLDEPTSALDPHSEQLIQESLITLKHKLTLFIVAHRMSTLNVCERVMVLVNGRLDAFDTSSELKQKSTYYRSALGVGASGE